MYETLYNLHALPFENTPDPRFFYESEQHREALAAIEYTIRMRKGYVLVTGAIGSGKTTVGRTMCERCGDKAQIIHVTHSHRTGDAVLRQVLRNLNIRIRSRDDHARLLDRLRVYLIDQLRQQQPVVLFVDEAQTLADEALEELRLLSTFDTATLKAIQIVLVGQPELRQRIASPKLAALRQRIVMAKQLHPLDESDTAAYITHRLRAASQDPNHVQVAFDRSASQLIYQYTGGIPRLINVICDNCMLMGYVRRTKQIDTTIVNRVVEDMLPTFDDGPITVVTPKQELRLAGNF